LIVGAVGAVAYAIYNYTKIETDLLENSNYTITDISIQSITTTALSLNVNLQLQNSSAINVNIQSLYLDIYVNGTDVGYVMQTMQTNIAPLGTVTIPLTATVNLSSSLNILTSQLGSILGGNARIDIKAVGTVSVNSGFINITVPVSIEKTLNI